MFRNPCKCKQYRANSVHGDWSHVVIVVVAPAGPVILIRVRNLCQPVRQIFTLIDAHGPRSLRQ